MDCVTVYPAKRRATVLAQAPRRKASPLQALAQAPQNLAPVPFIQLASAANYTLARQIKTFANIALKSPRGVARQIWQSILQLYIAEKVPR